MSSVPTTRPAGTGVAAELESRFADAIVDTQSTADGIPTLWITPQRVRDVLRWLKTDAPQPYRMLYDLTALDERVRKNGHQQLRPDFSVVYHLFSFERNADIRLKVALHGDSPTIQTITDIWPAANWYEREVWDMFGIRFEGHPDLRRILNPPGWVGHPLRKDHPARATDMPPFLLSHAKETAEQERLRFHPEEWGLKRQSEQSDFMFLNLGPHQPGNAWRIATGVAARW
jgi:NADH-quinone oxidoreductase subunit C/D